VQDSCTASRQASTLHYCMQHATETRRSISDIDIRRTQHQHRFSTTSPYASPIGLSQSHHRSRLRWQFRSARCNASPYLNFPLDMKHKHRPVAAAAVLSLTSCPEVEPHAFCHRNRRMRRCVTQHLVRRNRVPDRGCLAEYRLWADTHH
jgi:hypothetical protein